ncbi:unnamed protein product [Callosobruchus maculatus]|uniref:RING-type domain-containing protein n=1 Tax=Callosobruchus maculatus TaxID=64391 RepID=A0A653BZX9_CALMS|nr:unnamed protein product [Callosobruchus maculatus]
MTEINFSSSKLLKTKCGQCQLVCCVAPVSEESGSFYCGRCRPKGTPNRCFEEAAEKVVFPCIFGCEDQLIWGQALQHEVYCRNRTVVCPYVNCTSTSTLKDLHGHIKAYHQAFYQEAPKMRQVKLGTLELMVRLNCISFDKFVFLFFVKLERKTDIINFNYNVCLVWPQNYEQTELDNIQLRLEIEIPKSDLNVTKLIQSKNIVNYYDRSHCVNCLYQSCDKILHENKCNWIIQSIPLNMKDSLERDLFYTVTVYRKETVSGKAPDNLECPVCLDYMTDEIFFCGNGHSLCGLCNKKQSGRLCPVCRGNMLDSRNFAMENLVKQMNISCRKKFTGCTFVGLVAAVKTHEKSCKYP